MTYREKIAAIVKGWTKKSKLSQLELAGKLGISQPVFNRWLNGKEKIPKSRIKELIAELDPPKPEIGELNGLLRLDSNAEIYGHNPLLESPDPLGPLRWKGPGKEPPGDFADAPAEDRSQRWIEEKERAMAVLEVDFLRKQLALERKNHELEMDNERLKARLAEYEHHGYAVGESPPLTSGGRQG